MEDPSDGLKEWCDNAALTRWIYERKKIHGTLTGCSSGRVVSISLAILSLSSKTENSISNYNIHRILCYELNLISTQKV
eukprot:g5400.t1